MTATKQLTLFSIKRVTIKYILPDLRCESTNRKDWGTNHTEGDEQLGILFFTFRAHWVPQWKHFKAFLVSGVELHCWLQGLFQERVLRARSPRSSATWDDVRVLLDRRNLPVTHLLRRTSRVITHTNRSLLSRVRAILLATGESGQLMPRSPPSAALSIILQPNLWGAPMQGSLITFHIRNSHSHCLTLTFLKWQSRPRMHLTQAVTLWEKTHKYSSPRLLKDGGNHDGLRVTVTNIT